MCQMRVCCPEFALKEGCWLYPHVGNASFNADIDDAMTTLIILPKSTYLWEPK